MHSISPISYPNLIIEIVGCLYWSEKPKCRSVCKMWNETLNSIKNPRWWGAEHISHFYINEVSLVCIKWVEEHLRILQTWKTFTRLDQSLSQANWDDWVDKLSYMVSLNIDWDAKAKQRLFQHCCESLDLDLMMQTFVPNCRCVVSFTEHACFNKSDEVIMEALSWLSEVGIRNQFTSLSDGIYNGTLPLHICQWIFVKFDLIKGNFSEDSDWFRLFNNFELSKWVWSRLTATSKLKIVCSAAYRPPENEDHAIWICENILPTLEIREKMVSDDYDEPVYDIFAECPVQNNVIWSMISQLKNRHGPMQKFLDIIEPSIKSLFDSGKLPSASCTSAKSTYVFDWLEKLGFPIGDITSSTNEDIFNCHLKRNPMTPHELFKFVVNSEHGYKMLWWGWFNIEITDQTDPSLIHEFVEQCAPYRLTIMGTHPILIQYLTKEKITSMIGHCFMHRSSLTKWWRFTKLQYDDVELIPIWNHVLNESPITTHNIIVTMWLYEHFPYLRDRIKKDCLEFYKENPSYQWVLNMPY